jgi:hypothetical protein
MPPAYVKPYVKRQKNDATDAEATGLIMARLYSNMFLIGVYIGYVEAIALVGLLLGGAIGLITASLPLALLFLALLFLMEETNRNTRRTADYLMMIAGDRAPSKEPSFR